MSQHVTVDTTAPPEPDPTAEIPDPAAEDTPDPYASTDNFADAVAGWFEDNPTYAPTPDDTATDDSPGDAQVAEADGDVAAGEPDATDDPTAVTPNATEPASDAPPYDLNEVLAWAETLTAGDRARLLALAPTPTPDLSLAPSPSPLPAAASGSGVPGSVAPVQSVPADPGSISPPAPSPVVIPDLPDLSAFNELIPGFAETITALRESAVAQQQATAYIAAQQQTQAQIAQQQVAAEITQADAAYRASHPELADADFEHLTTVAASLQVMPALLAQHGTPGAAYQAALDMAYWSDPAYRAKAQVTPPTSVPSADATPTSTDIPDPAARRRRASAASGSTGSPIRTPRTAAPSGPMTRDQINAQMRAELQQAMSGENAPAPV